jgi:hypothetical protein
LPLLRQELRETNALLLLILQALAGIDMFTGKDGLMSHQLPQKGQTEMPGIDVNQLWTPARAIPSPQTDQKAPVTA